MLPLAVGWFESARSVDSNNEADIDKAKLGTIYLFVRAMPEVAKWQLGVIYDSISAMPEVLKPVPLAGEKRKRRVGK